MNIFAEFLNHPSWNVSLLNLVQEFDQVYFDHPWTKSIWEETYRSGNRYFLGVITAEDRVVAFLIYYLIPEEQLAHLLKIVVNPKSRRVRLGETLYLNCEQRLKEQGYNRTVLEVSDQNEAAIHFYQKHGFTQLHVVKNFYGNGRHALSLQKSL